MEFFFLLPSNKQLLARNAPVVRACMEAATEYTGDATEPPAATANRTEPLVRLCLGPRARSVRRPVGVARDENGRENLSTIFVFYFYYGKRERE